MKILNPGPWQLRQIVLPSELLEPKNKLYIGKVVLVHWTSVL